MSFTSVAALPAAAPDPTKRVNFSVGMVLGVDDFNQQFAYHAGRDRTLGALAVGAGTARGLEVSVSDTRVTVSGGLALSPAGELISVPEPQCADLNAWLTENRTAVEAKLAGSPPRDQLDVYVVLGYKHTLTDNVAIPANPNLVAAELTAPSRIADGFALELSLAAPEDSAALADQWLVDWLAELKCATASRTTIKDLQMALRSAAQASAGAGGLGTPPTSLVIPEAHAGDYLRAALAVWVTELHSGAADVAAASGSAADVLRLASLSLPIMFSPDLGPQVAPPGATVLANDRPVMLSPGLLAELVLKRQTLLAPAGIRAAIVGAGSFELRHEADGEEIELEVVFAQNIVAKLVARPGSDETPGEDEEAHGYERYVRIHLDGHRAAHRYVVTAIPRVERSGARYAIEEVLNPARKGAGSHAGQFELRLAPVAGRSRTSRVGFSVQIVDLGPKPRSHA